MLHRQSVLSGNILSGQVGHPHISSGAISSGQIAMGGTPIGTRVFRDDFTWADPVASGSVASGAIASGAVQGFFGSTRHIASGTVGVFDFGSGAVTAGTMGSGATVSGSIASGQVGTGHLADESVTSGDIASGSVSTFKIASGGLLSGAVGSGQIGNAHLGSGAVLSGHIASGQVGNFAVASGQIQGQAGGGTFNVASGSINTFDIGSGTIQSGRVASGQLGAFHHASGYLGSGFWVQSGAVWGRAGPNQFMIASGSIAGFDIASGGVLSGNIASGQIGPSHLGSGTVLSGHVASGQVGQFHVASGSITSGRIGVDPGSLPTGAKFLRDDFSWQSPGAAAVNSGDIREQHFGSGVPIRYVAPMVSGLGLLRPITEENVSGVRAVHLSQSGGLRVAMASVSGRRPAIGVVVGNVASGIEVDVFTLGQFQLSSGLGDFSGFIGLPLLLGRSGELTTSGSLLSGDLYQQLGVSLTSGDILVELGNANVSGGPLGSGAAGSGSVASGAVQGFFGTTRQIASGTVGVSDFGSGAVVAGTVGSGAVVSGNVASGQIGSAHLGSGSVLSGHVASGNVWGLVGPLPHVASGSFTGFELGSGSVVSGRIASGQIGGFAISSGSVTSGRIGVNPATLPDGTKFLRDDFSWQTAGGSVGSGDVNQNEMASGVAANYDAPIISGLGLFRPITEEPVSGVRAVHISQSGNIRVAMASVSGRRPAVGVIVDNVASGIEAFVYTKGLFKLTSGLGDFSGFIGLPLLLGRSGELTTSGPLLSGDIHQQMGIAWTSGDILVEVANALASGGPGLGSGAVTSGTIGSAVVSGIPLSGSVTGQAGGGFFVVASGTLGTFDVGSGAIQSGRIASGQVGQFHLASGSILSGFWVGSGSIFGQAGPNQFCIASGTIGTFDIGSGAIVSGRIASGQVGNFHVASGQVQGLAGTGVPNIASGSLTGFELGSGSVVSGRIASGQVGNFHVASGQIQGLAGAGVPNVASGSLGGFELGSGAIVSGRVASGQLGAFHHASGFLGSGFWIQSGGLWGRAGVDQFMIASGTIATFDIASGGVVSGNIASGQIGQFHLSSGSVTSGVIASGQIGQFQLASGLAINYDAPIISGFGLTGVFQPITEEIISGVRAVHLSQSGQLRVAMASVSGRRPAIGVVKDNVASGIQAVVYTKGLFKLASGLGDFSGFIGLPLLLGRSGELTASGALLSGDIYQQLGIAWTSGDVLVQVGNALASGGPGLGSGAVTSGTIGLAVVSGVPLSGSVTGQAGGGYFVVASGSLGTFDIGSGAVQSGRVASGSLGAFHHASGFLGSGFWIQSGSVFGQAGPNQFCIASGTVTTNDLGSGAIQSGTIASGQIGRFHIGSGTLAGFELGSGAIVSGRVASGQIGNFHVASGQIQGLAGVGVPNVASGSFTGFELGSGSVVSGRIASGQIGNFHIASGQVQGQAGGGTFNIASGTVNTFDIGSGSVRSGHIASGQVPNFAVGSGAVTSGRIGMGGTPTGTNFFRDDFSWQAVTATINSGDIRQQHIASGVAARLVAPFVSGYSLMATLTEETVSGVRAVVLSQSGNLRVAMASVSGRMPAVGVVVDNVLSGIEVNVYTLGVFQAASGLVDFSGYVGQSVLVGRSGQLVTASGGFNSGGLLSGDVTQPIGAARNSGAFEVAVAATLPFVVSPMLSGNIGSGQVADFHLASGAAITNALFGAGNLVSGPNSDFPVVAVFAAEPISGVRAVAVNQSGQLQVAMAAVSGRMPAVGVAPVNIASGAIGAWWCFGTFQFPSGMVDYSGRLGLEVFVGRSGQVVARSGSWNSGGFLSGDLVQSLGVVLNSGAIWASVGPVVASGNLSVIGA